MTVGFAQVPFLCVIVHNASMTVDNMRGFSAIFASQAGALQTERRKTEDLLTEMLPRSVAKLLRAGRTVQAEQYDVRLSVFNELRRPLLSHWYIYKVSCARPG